MTQQTINDAVKGLHALADIISEMGASLPSKEVINSTSAADVPNSEEKDETKGEERDLPPLDSPIEKEAGKKAGKEGAHTKRARGVVFIKPTREEVLAFVRENKLELDVEYFFDYYESNGWMVGRTHMKDWKATARNWSRRDRLGNSKTEPKFTGTRASNWRGTRKEDLDDVLG